MRTLALKGFSVLMALALCAVMVPAAAARPALECPPLVLKSAGPLFGTVIIPVCPEDPPKKASIVLTVVNPPAGAWASVEWLNLAGTTWTAVPGWTGLLNQGDHGFMLFAVDDADLGTGPFRWVVYDQDPAQGGKVWGVTENFNLPQKHDWLRFTVSQK